MYQRRKSGLEMGSSIQGLIAGTYSWLMTHPGHGDKRRQVTLRMLHNYVAVVISVHYEQLSV